MTAPAGLLGAIIGAVAALAGQLIMARAADLRKWLEKLFVRCAQIYALEREVDMAAWEAAQGRSGRMDTWDFSTRRQAEAEVLPGIPSGARSNRSSAAPVTQSRVRI